MSAEDISLHEPQIDRAHFRSVVSLFATGVAIVSVCQEGAPGGVHGMTINSFTSISLDPPTVMISLRPGLMQTLILNEGSFGVSLLNQHQQHHSEHFSGQRGSGTEARFDVRAGVPVLADALAWFDCAVTEHRQINDHTLFFARVMACAGREGEPLMFHASRYRQGFA